MIVMKRILKIILGVAVSAAGIGLMIHWGNLGFLVGSMMIACYFLTDYRYGTEEDEKY